MVVKNTLWEQRNLGVNGIEYYFDLDDTAEIVNNEILIDNDHNYQVAHLPVGKMDVFSALVDGGFKFIETKFGISTGLKVLQLPQVYTKYIGDLDYHPACKQELEQIYAVMENGVFDTDKISLDPYFGKEVAGKRYVLWSQEEIGRGTCKPYYVTFRNVGIGFFVLRNVSNSVADSFLAGLFDRANSLGLGFSVLYFPMLQAKREGKRTIVSGVSSNNPASVRAHLSLGYEIDAMEYILVKHLS